MKVALVSLPFWPNFYRPLGTAYLSSALQEEGIEVKVFDLNAELASKYSHLGEKSPWNSSLIMNNENNSYFINDSLPLIKGDIRAFIEILMQEKFDYVGFSITSLSFLTTNYVAKLIRVFSPQTTVFCGGPEVYFNNKLITECINNRTFDIAFEGESEETLVEFFKAKKNGTPCEFLPGTITRANLEKNERSPRPSLVNYSTCDSLINGNVEVLEEFVDLIIENNVKCTWLAYCRVDSNIDLPLAKKMYLAGCRELQVGYESGSQHVLDLMNKRTKVSDGDTFTKNIALSNIKIHGLFLLGFPGETERDFRDTLKFIHRNRFYIDKISTGFTLGITLDSMIGVNPKKYGVSTNEDGTIKYDENGEWVSDDPQTSPTNRYQRLESLRHYLDAFSLN